MLRGSQVQGVRSGLIQEELSQGVGSFPSRLMCREGKGSSPSRSPGGGRQIEAQGHPKGGGESREERRPAANLESRVSKINSTLIPSGVEYGREAEGNRGPLRHGELFCPPTPLGYSLTGVTFL